MSDSKKNLFSSNHAYELSKEREAHEKTKRELLEAQQEIVRLKAELFRSKNPNASQYRGFSQRDSDQDDWITQTHYPGDY